MTAPRSSYDVIVIGLSLGALATGALLARRGFRVVALGHGSLPHRYDREGKALYRGLGALTAHETPAFRRVFAELALLPAVRRRLSPLDPAWQVVLPRRRIDVPAAVDRRVAEVLREFPEVPRAVEEFYRGALGRRGLPGRPLRGRPLLATRGILGAAPRAVPRRRAAAATGRRPAGRLRERPPVSHLRRRPVPLRGLPRSGRAHHPPSRARPRSGPRGDAGRRRARRAHPDAPREDPPARRRGAPPGHRRAHRRASGTRGWGRARGRRRGPRRGVGRHRSRRGRGPPADPGAAVEGVHADAALGAPEALPISSTWWSAGRCSRGHGPPALRRDGRRASAD